MKTNNLNFFQYVYVNFSVDSFI